MERQERQRVHPSFPEATTTTASTIARTFYWNQTYEAPEDATLREGVLNSPSHSENPTPHNHVDSGDRWLHRFAIIIPTSHNPCQENEIINMVWHFGCALLYQFLVVRGGEPSRFISSSSIKVILFCTKTETTWTCCLCLLCTAPTPTNIVLLTQTPGLTFPFQQTQDITLTDRSLHVTDDRSSGRATIL